MLNTRLVRFEFWRSPIRTRGQIQLFIDVFKHCYRSECCFQFSFLFILKVGI